MTLLTPPTSYTYVLVTYDPATSVAVFGPGPGVDLPAGDYQFRLVSGGVTDPAGNVFSPDYAFQFSIPAAAPSGLTTQRTPAKPVRKAPVFNAMRPIKRPMPRATPRREFAFD